MTDGRLTGAGLVQGLAELLNLEQLRDLRFSRSEGTFTVRNGKVLVNGNVNGKDLRLRPEGTIGLDDYALDFALNLRVAPSLLQELNQGKLLGLLVDEQGWGKIPVKVGGTAQAPRFSLDTVAIRENLQEKTGEEIRKKLRQELEKRFPSGNDKTAPEPGRPGLKDALRGLLGN